jgi:hypothetical protein
MTANGIKVGVTRRAKLALHCFLLVALLCVTSLSVSPSSASAAVVTGRSLLFSFDGSDTTAGKFQSTGTLNGLTAVAADASSGDIYAYDGVNEAVDRFNAAGEAKDFSAGPAAGTSSLYGPPGATFAEQSPFFTGLYTDLAVDNSGGAGGPGEGEQGRLYISGNGGPVLAFDPEGNYLWSLPVAATGSACGAAVDADGHLWLSSGGKVVEFANSGSPPAQIASFPFSVGNKSACDVAVDQGLEDVYVANQWNLGGESEGGLHKYVNGIFDSTVTTQKTWSLASDQSKPLGSIFAIEDRAHEAKEAKLVEYEACATPGCGAALVGSYGDDLIGMSMGLAYDSTLDRLYVPSWTTQEVQVFGPKTTGTVPDVTAGEADEIGQNTATIHGTVNPQATPTNYYFEYKVSGGPTWATAERVQGGSCEPAPLPEDTADHAVSCELGDLQGNTEYELRLVGENSDNKLRAYSAPGTFETLAPPVPAVDGCTISAVTSNSAHLACSVDSQGDKTTWRVLRSHRPDAGQADCEALADSAFTKTSEGVIPGEEVAATEVEADLTGLLPGETSCVRLSATNGGGTGREDLVFLSTPIPPSNVESAFVAPRTDTGARLNGWVDPEGDASFTYRFEFSSDGVNWSPLPARESTANARGVVLVAEELVGLSPGTTYEYRLSAENAAGEASPQGAAKAFETRTAAEVAAPDRGIELVSSPEKGNQNIRTETSQDIPSISPDGNLATWNVLAGAPGANTGAGASFLSERTPQGWQSRSLIPPAAGQIENGEAGGYLLGTNTPDLSAFIFTAGRTALESGKYLVRTDAHQHQTVLAEFSVPIDGGKLDLTGDGSHVFLVTENAPRQIEDLGSGPPEVVSIMPDGTLNACGLSAIEANSSFAGGGANNPQGAALYWRAGYHMVATTDASRVYFQAKPNSGPCASSMWGLYVRNRESEETVLIDPGTAGKSPNFVRATPDGREAYFATHSQLDPADTNASRDIYRWEEEAGVSHCMTCVVPDASVSGNIGAILVSDDFSHIYFESTKQLVPERGREGESNLYVLSDGQLRFVVNINSFGGTLWKGEPELSSDGNVLLIVPSTDATAHQQLTTDELASKCALLKNTNPEPCQELFRYDDRDGSLECISCNPAGVTTNNVGAPSTSVGGSDFTMSPDGGTVAFATREKLVELDVNRSLDIYEWRNGIVRLVSDGITTYPESLTATPQVQGVSVDGRDIFFSLVGLGLTGFEQDGFSGLYDARIGGGFEPTAPPVHCEEDSCQGPLEAAPANPQAGSASFSGHGNLKAPPRRSRGCARKRGKAKRNCIRAQRRKKGTRRHEQRKRRLQHRRENHNRRTAG